MLDRLAPSPLNTMNRAVAVAEWQGAEAGLAVLAEVHEDRARSASGSRAEELTRSAARLVHVLAQDLRHRQTLEQGWAVHDAAIVRQRKARMSKLEATGKVGRVGDVRRGELDALG